MLMWFIAVCAFTAGAVYVIGGREFVRGLLRARSRATAALQPPTQAEMQRAAQGTAGATASQTDAILPPPASPRVMAIWIGSTLIVVVALFVLTAHYPRRRRRD
jgi:hypothetical protein